MAKLKLVLSCLLVVAIVAVGFIFFFRNDTPISVNFIVFSSSSLGVGFWILSSFVLGVLLGWLIGLPRELLLKATNKKNLRKLRNQETELSRLKRNAVKGN
jgi:uncharacterized integral membrane protein